VMSCVAIDPSFMINGFELPALTQACPRNPGRPERS
jgi:hypothetical protein